MAQKQYADKGLSCEKHGLASNSGVYNKVLYNSCLIATLKREAHEAIHDMCAAQGGKIGFASLFLNSGVKMHVRCVFREKLEVASCSMALDKIL